MKYLLTLCLLCLLMGSCKEEPHLPPGKMENVLFDMQLAEVRSTMVKKDSTAPSNERNLDSLAFYYQGIFAHHGITRSQFDESMKWYEGHPEDMDSVYAHVALRLNKAGEKYNLNQ